jgi:hypothetical protein
MSVWGPVSRSSACIIKPSYIHRLKDQSSNSISTIDLRQPDQFIFRRVFSSRMWSRGICARSIAGQIDLLQDRRPNRSSPGRQTTDNGFPMSASHATEKTKTGPMISSPQMLDIPVLPNYEIPLSSALVIDPPKISQEIVSQQAAGGVPLWRARSK